jgi:hypothetical protein
LPRKKGKGSGFEKRVTSRYKKGRYNVKQNVIGKRNGRKYEIDAIIERGKERYPTEMNGGRQILTTSQVLATYKKLSYRKGTPTLMEERYSPAADLILYAFFGTMISIVWNYVQNYSSWTIGFVNWHIYFRSISSWSNTFHR